MHRLGLRYAVVLSVAALFLGCGDDRTSVDSGVSRAASLAKPPLKGTLHGWPEATAYLLVNLDEEPATVALGRPRTSGLDAFWSLASSELGGSGFFYSDAIRQADETRVAYPSEVHRVQDIHDASRFDYSAGTVGPVPAGAIVLVHHLPTDRYLALVIDRIEPTDARTAGGGPYAYADVTWYLSVEGGAADFSGAL